MKNNEKLIAGQRYVVKNYHYGSYHSGLTSVKVIESTNKCYLLRFKDSELSNWYTIEEFHEDYEVIESLGY